jgi:hypothetical protein
MPVFVFPQTPAEPPLPKTPTPCASGGIVHPNSPDVPKTPVPEVDDVVPKTPMLCPVAAELRPVWVVVVAAIASNISALAEIARQEADPNQRQVYLIRKDQSDCTNSDVPNVDSPLVGGNIWVTRLQDGNTSVKVAMTAKPGTTYHFFLKCVRRLTDITTDEEGVANVSLAFPTNLVGAEYGFDMYPEGAPPGNKYQSAQVSFR